MKLSPEAKAEYTEPSPQGKAFFTHCIFFVRRLEEAGIKPDIV